MTYANPPWWQPLTNGIGLARRISRKASQKMRRGNRPPAGGEQLSAKVVEHWRQEPDRLTSLASVVPVRDDWIEGVLVGRIEPRPSSVAYLTNLAVATGSV